MVWAIVERVGLGKHFPDGDYVGREEQVLGYYNSGMTEAEKIELGLPNDYPLLAFLKDAASSKFTEDRGPLRSHEQPVEFETVKNYPSLASLIKLNQRLLAVDEALKAVIEEFEPGVHQFWPIRIKMPRGDYPAPYYAMVIRQFRDSCLPEQCQLTPGSASPQKENGLFFAADSSRKGYAALTLSGAVIGSAHLWREKRLRNPNIFMSDALQAAIKARGLEIRKHYQVKVV